MDKQHIINTSKAPRAIGTYSQAISIKNFIFTSGQIPIVKETNELISAEFSEQAVQTLKNLDNLIESAGSNRNKIIKLSVYLTDLNNFESLNKTFNNFFKKDTYPARTVIEVSKIPKDSQIAIEAICYI